MMRFTSRKEFLGGEISAGDRYPGIFPFLPLNAVKRRRIYAARKTPGDFLSLTKAHTTCAEKALLFKVAIPKNDKSHIST